MKPKNPLRNILLLTGSIALTVSFAQATPLYWDVNGQTAGFSTVVGGWNGTNVFWNTDATGGAGGTVQAGTTSGDDLIISQAAVNTGSITVTGARLASSITFAPNVGPTTNITGGSGSIAIGGTGASSGIFQQSTGANTVSTALILNPANTAFAFNSTGAGALSISGSVTGSASIGNIQTINVSSSSGNITLTGAITDGLNGGKVAVAYGVPGGVTTLSSSNTFSGGFTLNSGQVGGMAVGTYNGFGTGTLTLNGGSLRGPNTTAAIIIPNNVAWNGNIGFGRAGGGNPIFTFNGNITLGASVAATTAAGTEPYSLTFNGNIGESSPGFGLNLSAASTGSVWTFNGQNTFTGNLTTNSKALVIGGSGYLGGGSYGGNIVMGAGTTATMTYSSSADQTLSGVISGTSVTKNTSTTSTLTLTAANTYSGGTTVSAGTLLASNTTGSATGTGAVSVDVSGATLGGTGRIAPTGIAGISVSTGGHLAPGSPGLGNRESLEIALGGAGNTGVVTMASGSDFRMELGTANLVITTIVLNSSDLLFISGASVNDVVFNSNNVDFLGTGQVGFYKLFDSTLAAATIAADTWGGLIYDASTGVVSSGLNVTNLAANLTGTFIMGGLSSGGDAGDIYLSVVAIPEPNVAALIGAFGGILLLRRRR